MEIESFTVRESVGRPGRVELVVVIDGQPRVLEITPALAYALSSRLEAVTQAITGRTEDAESRGHAVG